MKRFVILFTIFNLIIGCASFSKKVAFENNAIINEESIKQLNGTYEIGITKAITKFENLKPVTIEKDSINRLGLYEILKETNQELREDIKNNIESYHVKIEVKNKNTIFFALLKNEKLIDSSKMKFKLKDGFVYLKNKNFKTFGVPIIAGNFELNRTKIGLNNSKNLILYNSYFLYGAILVIIGDTKKSNIACEYKRKI
ncbi:hypothetical protein KIH23_10090 [Flavobacterium sp. CYK-55]|uniref:hypothetical protein n=1 Tax=Flavobacterium sp. CYK-55 TaxID=2835529 RepID=UPI001BCDAE12|nr:hypothetical protein [Flavobacterium sp. CYK-55]MBS7787647.1 hypothetical protein [Flavobacterium sp. CYK-55]